MISKKRGRPTKRRKVIEKEEKNPEPLPETSVTEVIDEGDKLLQLKAKDLRELGYDTDPFKIKCPIDPETGKPKWAFRACHDMHREKRGGLGTWVPMTRQFMKDEGIELPNNPLPQHTKRGNDNRVFVMDHYICVRPYEVNEVIRKKISEKSTRRVKDSENMEKVAAEIKERLGNRAYCQIMDAVTTIKKRYY